MKALRAPLCGESECYAEVFLSGFPLSVSASFLRDESLSSISDISRDCRDCLAGDQCFLRFREQCITCVDESLDCARFTGVKT